MFFPWEEVETRPELQRVEITFGTLPDGAFFAALHNRRGAGRNNFPVAVMWRAVSTGIVFQLASVEAPLRELNRNTALLDQCWSNQLTVQR